MGLSPRQSVPSHQAQPASPPGPRYAPGICLDWLQGRCRRDHCKYKHGQVVSVDWLADTVEKPITIPQAVSEEHHVRPHRPLPPSTEVCRRWLRGICQFGYACKHVHNDLDYDEPQKPDTVVSSQGVKPIQSSFIQMVTLRDHIVVKVDTGFEVIEVSTGFDTPWLSLDHVPAKVNPADLRELLETFGTVLDLKFPKTVISSPYIHVKAKFTSSAEAQQALALDGASAFGSRLSVHLPLRRSIRTGGGQVDESTLRVEWEYPSRTVYCGYASLEQARKAMEIARQPWRDMEITAELHTGHPVLGIATVRFRNMPSEIEEEELAHFADPIDFMWERPAHNIPIKETIAGIKTRLEKIGTLATFDVQQPPYRYGTLRAWARYSTSALAQRAVEELHKRKPQCTGFTRITVQNLKAISYRLPSDVYSKVAFDIRNLAIAISLRGQRSATSIRVDHAESVAVKVCSADIKILGQLKRELERLLHGEIVYQNGRVAWDSYFLSPNGISFLADLERQTPGAQVKRLPTQRCIKIFGSSFVRALLKRDILKRLNELNTQTVRSIPVSSRIIGALLKSELATLEREWGGDNVTLDLGLRVVRVRGNDRVFNSVHKVVRGLESLHHYTRLQLGHCPVCLGEVTSPVSLPCEHVWCRSCLVGYLNAAVSNKYFPLACLGNEAKCQQRIPIGLARDVLSPAEFDALIDAAFTSYLYSHADDFHYCPTPDCQQIYRVGEANSPPLQCPSCLIHICSFCHVEYHQDFQCRDDESGDELFRAWMEANGIKKCPGCKIPIEKAAGCNHMACTQCHTHLCWVCMKTFPEGQGIYDHMRTEHGGIGDAVFL
ncbi:hypothetical protein BDN72DRAFT_822286 [Pluteus cervinus]|uniref:Uncharacterized protein n=1 Tax=Pluteus cervinus TaxID=181527 RepID=A0ACD3APC8_9AGAR|nr:hypothetical protein BDN72DRAFT_822286 [Pluteus cervinus]